MCLGFGIPDALLAFTPDNFHGLVANLALRLAVDFCKHSIVDVLPKCIADGVKIPLQAIA
jgi:hypothetical protein